MDKMETEKITETKDCTALAPITAQGLGLALTSEQALALVADAWAQVDHAKIAAEADDQAREAQVQIDYRIQAKASELHGAGKIERLRLYLEKNPKYDGRDKNEAELTRMVQANARATAEMAAWEANQTAKMKDGRAQHISDGISDKIRDLVAPDFGTVQACYWRLWEEHQHLLRTNGLAAEDLAPQLAAVKVVFDEWLLTLCIERMGQPHPWKTPLRLCKAHYGVIPEGVEGEFCDAECGPRFAAFMETGLKARYKRSCAWCHIWFEHPDPRRRCCSFECAWESAEDLNLYPKDGPPAYLLRYPVDRGDATVKSQFAHYERVVAERSRVEPQGRHGGARTGAGRPPKQLPGQ